MFGTYQRLNVSIYASDREVIRAVAKKFKRAALHKHEFRAGRHQIYRQMLDYHHNARKLARQWGL